MAYPQQVARGTPAVAVVAPRYQRFRRAGGGLLLIWTGDQNFLFLVPWLVFGGTVLFVLEPRLSHRGGARGNRGLAKALWPLAVAGVFVVAIYGGYFGAG